MTRKPLALLTVIFALFLSGCAQKQNENSSMHAAPQVRTKETQPRNGTVLSMKRLIVGMNHSDLYEMYYQSEGEKVQAYVELPAKPGTYPLMVACHGGSTIPRQLTHQNMGWQYDTIGLHSGQAIYLYPEYRGYNGSGGTVPGILGVIHDINNAITATQSLKGLHVSRLYLYGISLGGGAVLQLASERDDVKAVAVDSPFVGFDATIKWFDKLEKQETSSYISSMHKTFLHLYGNHLAAAAYTARSPIDHISTIHAPVLLLQGTDDNHVIWQSVQAYAEDMKKDHKTVKFVLVKGGQHGLVDHANTYGEGVSFPDTWFQKYGFPQPLF